MSKDDDFSIDFDESTLDDTSRPIYEALNKQFRNAWLKKSQGAADERKRLQAEMAEVQKQYQEAEQERTAFRNWWAAEGQYQYATPEQGARAEGFEQPDAIQRELHQLRQQFQQAATRYDQTIQGLTDKLNVTEQAMRMQQDLWGLRWKHKDKDIDPKKILETARDRNVTDLNLAYELAYGEADRQKEVEERATKLAEERIAQKEAESKIVETPKTSHYAPPETAKSYSEASKGLLQSVRSGGGTGPLLD